MVALGGSKLPSQPMSVIKSNAHLERCSVCRKMILSTADKCPHCGAVLGDSMSFRAASWIIRRLVLPALVLIALVSLLVLAVTWTEKQRQHRTESVRALREGAFP